MRLFLLFLVIVSISGCASSGPAHPPSTAAVKSNISSASGSIGLARKSSELSSGHIKSFKSDAERIDYKATKALEFF